MFLFSRRLNNRILALIIIAIKNWLLGGVWQPDPEMRKQIPFTNFPRTLEGFGYYFNEAGEMRHLKTNERFEFNEREHDHFYNQKRYEAIGDLVTDYLDNEMMTKYNLQQVFIPVDATDNEPQSYIFLSDDFMTNSRLLILIHGSGAVRAGQWSRRLIINDCIQVGSQLPFIKKALKEGYSILVMNTNFNSVLQGRKDVTIRENENAELHGRYVWQNFVLKSAARDIAILAHSYGGIVTVATATEFPKDFIRRVFAIAFTDTVHGYMLRKVHPKIRKLLKKRAINFASSHEPLETRLIQSEPEDCPAVSAGTPMHELTSWKSFDSIFKFFETRYKVWLEDEDRYRITAELDAERQMLGSVAGTDPSLEWEPDDSFLINAGILKPPKKETEKPSKSDLESDSTCLVQNGKSAASEYVKSTTESANGEKIEKNSAEVPAEPKKEATCLTDESLAEGGGDVSDPVNETTIKASTNAEKHIQASSSASETKIESSKENVTETLPGIENTVLETKSKAVRDAAADSELDKHLSSLKLNGDNTSPAKTDGSAENRDGKDEDGKDTEKKTEFAADADTRKAHEYKEKEL